MQLPQVPPEPLSIVEFLPILMGSEIKLELIDGQIDAFPSGTVAHGLLCDRILGILRSAAEPDSEVFASDVALRHADAATFVFPDASYTDETLFPVPVKSA